MIWGTERREQLAQERLRPRVADGSWGVRERGEDKLGGRK